MRSTSYLLLPFFLAGAAFGAPRHNVEIDRNYDGKYQSAFTYQSERVRLLTRQAQLETSARLGLYQYREGFQYPIKIRFVDSVPSGLESSLAFVRYGRNESGFLQELVVNMSMITQQGLEFDQIFRHEMTHAVLNDAVGGEATYKIPHWLQEGLAQYVSEEGDARVREAGQHVRRSQAERLLCDLDGPYLGQCYPQYYLAIRYLYEKYSSNAVQGLVRSLIAGKSLEDALRDTINRSQAQFEQEVRSYSLGVFQDKALPDL
jgi:hypothetical protein